MISNIIKQNIKQDLFQWVKGINEDDPLPYEIKYIYFIVSFKNKDIELSYTGADVKLTFFDFGPYLPLEAEYFYSNSLKFISKNLYNKKSNISKQEILDFLHSCCLSLKNNIGFLMSTQIFFGERFTNINV